jgi:NAD(P)-dependent dehydrogenase (short-subunit alcohol dehydrogenase family)
MNDHVNGRLAGKVAIVTGASRGIGCATAVRLAAEGARVALVARTEKSGERRLAGSLEDTANRIKALGADCVCITADLVDPTKRGHIVAETVRHFGGVDILVNNAAWSRFQPARDQRSDHVRRCFEVNYFAPLELIQQCVPSMTQRGAGWIVNLSSATVNHPAPAPFDHGERYFRFNAELGPSIYGSSKAALEQLSAILGAEQANVRVYRVDPGDMNTQMHQEAFPGEDISDRPPPEASVPGIIELIDSNAPSGRYAARAMALAG